MLAEMYSKAAMKKTQVYKSKSKSSQKQKFQNDVNIDMSFEIFHRLRDAVRRKCLNKWE
jgi:hypothetical protein